MAYTRPGVAAGLSSPYVTEAQGDARFAAITSAPLNVLTYGAFGDGTSDDSPGISAALAALNDEPGSIFFPRRSTPYRVSEPIVLAAGQRLIGETVSNSSEGVSIKALASFAGLAVVMSSSWTQTATDWWHWGSVENVRINCNSVAANGVAVYQMGENSTLRAVLVQNATGAGFLMTGAHAPLTLENCNATSCDYGLKITSHPSLAGNSGDVRIFGFSGDYNTTAHVYINGGQVVDLVGLKSENNNVGIELAGSSTPVLRASGYLNTGVDAVKVTGTAQPVITLSGFRAQSYTNYVNDTVASKTLTLAQLSTHPGLIRWGGTTWHDDASLVLGPERAITGVRTDTGAQSSMLVNDTSVITKLRALSGNGVGFYDSSGNSIALATAQGLRIQQGGLRMQLATKTDNYTIAAATDSIILASGSGKTITLPSAVTVGAGREFTIKNIDGSNAVTVAASAGSVDVTSLAAGVGRRYISDGTNWYSL